MVSKSFVFRFDDVEVREREFTVIKAGKVLAVEPKAFRALLFMLHNPQRLISKEELLNAVWGQDRAITDRTVDVYVLRLRQKIEPEGGPAFIRSVRGFGYSFNVEAPQAVLQ